MDIILQALSEPHRREILRLVQDRELGAGEISRHFSVSGPAISQHLRVLLEAGLLTMRREGTRRLYRARPEGLVEVRTYLAQFWQDGLHALKEAAEEEERRAQQSDNPTE